MNFHRIAYVGLVATAAVAVMLFSPADEQRVTFEDARHAPNLRVNYVRQLVSRVGQPAVVRTIEYVDADDRPGLKRVLQKYNYTEQEVVHGTTAMSTMVDVAERIPVSELGTRSLPVTILVFPLAFEGTRYMTENDFISGLSHEYFHATEFYNHGRAGSLPFSSFVTVGGELNVPLIKGVGELDAFRVEMRSQAERISPGYKRDRMTQYLQEYVTLWKRDEGMDPSFIAQLKVEFFEAWMLDHPSLLEDEENGVETWYLEDANTLRRYTLSQPEIRRIRTKLAEEQ